MKTIWNNLSLRAKIITMVILILGVYMSGSLIETKIMLDAYRADAMATGKQKAVALSNSLTAQFYERYGDVQAFAINADVVSLKKDRITATLDAYVKLYGIYDVILVTDRNGHLVATNSKDLSGKTVDFSALEKIDYSKSNWFQAVVQGKTTDDEKKGLTGTFFEDFQVDPIQKLALGENRWSASFSSAIKNEKGEIIGVVTNRSNAKWASDELVKAYDELKSYGQVRAEIKIVNKDNLFVLNHFPAGNGDKNEFKMDLDILGKAKLENEHSDIIKYFSENKSGVTVTFDDELKEYQIVGFNKVDDSKFVSSIGWSVLVMDLENEILAAVNSSQKQLYIFSAAMFVFGCVIALIFAHFISNQMKNISNQFKDSSEKVAFASQAIAEQSTQISSATTEQASAIQETMAAVDEIGAMVEKNAEASKRSKDFSLQSKKTAEQGQETVQNMLGAINDISQTNDEISKQMDQNNLQIAEVVRLISDIGNKTKVINEIVFQTKLLSFNASVEAARAGEYGKGFSVVAEEVGNLAQMSGAAAQEISQMLSESIRRAEAIVQDTKSRVDKMMNDSRHKIEIGNSTAKDCDKVLAEIVKNINSVDMLVSEITVASEEQSNGIREISKAVGLLDVSTQQNSGVAQQASKEAVGLKDQSEDLYHVVKQVLQIVDGSTKSVTDKQERQFENHTSESHTPKKEQTQPRSKVFKFSEKVKQKSTLLTKEKNTNNEAQAVFKKASGSEEIPSSDDNRFEEV